MNVTAVVDFTSAVFMSIIFVRRLADKSTSKNYRQLMLCLTFILVLLIDALAFTLKGPKYPVPLRYFLTLISMLVGVGILVIEAAYYYEELFLSMTDINPWVFRTLKIVSMGWLTAAVTEVFTHRMISYPGGVESVNTEFPMYIAVLEVVILMTTPVISIVYRKQLGREMTVLSCLFSVVPMIAFVLYATSEVDFTYATCAVTYLLVDEFIQKRQADRQREEIEAKRIESEHLKETQLQLRHEHLRAEVSNYLIDHDDDPIELLKHFAAELRTLLDCDQVVYRDLETTRIMVNSPTIGDSWAVPDEYCKFCGHYDAQHPMYSNGYSEMENCREGWRGFPVHYNCPIKSSLTRIVYCDREISGYLAVHYVTDYHHFTDVERSTMEEFARMLSIALSRYKARQENKELKITQEMQQKYKEALERARIAAETANQSKTNFLFNMSHDIRTPMNAIRGFTTMAKAHVDERDKVVEYLDKIDISGQQLLTLINQVLEMARIESGKLELEEKPVSIRNEFNSMVTVLSEQAEANGLNFTYELVDLVHNNVLTDEAKVSSITLNIVGNSIKYTMRGGNIRFCLREIPNARPGYATFVYTVEDTGIGMSREYLKVLFDPFTREKSSTVSRIQGTGLGLSIVKHTVDLLGGSIKVESEPGKGTKFDITVDFKTIDDAEWQNEAEETAEAVSFENRRILVVEDNEMNREIARSILEEQGFVIETADDGDVAVDMYKQVFERRDYHYYDLILMDVQMQRMNGYDATGAIRDIEKGSGIHIPILAMTANAFEEDRQDAFAAGMDEHIAKPIDVKKMLKTISKFL